LVQGPGLKRSHSNNREVSLGGQARVYSRVLGEANKSLCGFLRLCAESFQLSG